ncbi:MAG: lipocalin-like domain-containing protein [Pseudomonadota bacterium]|nr:lipocalin-like domain-containing protein [Pseudomonadota bacterium]
MRRVITAILSCGLVVSFLHRAQSAQPSPTAAQKLTKQVIVGAWRLISIDYSGPNGALTDPVFGPNPQGLIIYEQSGWMSVQIVTANRPVMTRPATRTSGLATADDAKLAAGAFDTYYAYFGTWDFNADTSVITHHLKSSLLPYETGLDYRREVTFDGVHLKLSARSHERGEERRRTLVWTRVSAGPIGEPSATPPASEQDPSPSAGSPTPLTQAPPPPASITESGPPQSARVVVTKYGDMPTDYKEAIRRYFLEHLKYPDTIQYGEVTKPELGYTTAITGTFLMRETRQYGWTVKATINAKNYSNNYVGFKTYTFLFRGEKIVATRLPLPGDEMNDIAVKH